MKLSYELQVSKKLKKLPENQREQVLEALLEIQRNPFQGDHKVGDLLGELTFRFRVFQELWLIAYTFVNEQELRILKIGPYENFYRDLKK